MGRSKLRIDKDGRECIDCGKYQSWDNYYIDKAAKPWGRKSNCKACFKRRRNKFSRTEVIKTPSIPTKICRTCNKNKPRSDFGMGNVRINHNCKDCIKYVTNLPKDTRLMPREVVKNHTVPNFDPTAPIDLSFLADLGGFNSTEIKKLLYYVNIYTQDPHNWIQLKIFQEFFPHRKPKLCKQIVDEFTEVYMKRLDFDKYIAEGRKLRKDGKKEM